MQQKRSRVKKSRAIKCNYAQHGVCCYGGWTFLASAMCRHRRQFQRDQQSQTYNSYLQQQNKSGQAVWAGRTMNTATAASPVRYLQPIFHKSTY